MTSLAQRLKQGMDRKPDARPADLARAAGVSGVTVSHWLNGKIVTLKAESVRRAAKYLGCDRDWLANGSGFPHWADEQHPVEGAQPRGEESQLLRHPPAQHSPLITWGEKMSAEDLPPTFRVALPDDSMAPARTAGQVIEFAAGGPPKPGAGVLVQDGAGRLYYRAYRELPAGQWEAYPLNTAYLTLHSLRDGLQLLAVQTAVHTDRP